MNKFSISKIVTLFLVEFLLAIILFIVIIFGISYIQTNLYAFTDFSILKFGSSFDRFWMGSYLFTNALFTLVINLMLVEIFLFTFRLMAKTALSTYEKLTNKELTKVKAFFHDFSIIYLFKLVKINNRKRALILYVIIMVLIFGVKFGAKQVLVANDTSLYRVYENINLYSDIYTNDLTADITNDVPYSLNISTSVGNVHLYTLQEVTEIKVVYLYDTLLQKCTLDYVLDEDTKTITIGFNEDIYSYTKYEDDLLPQIEVYLPKDLVLDTIDISISTSGDIAMEYINAQNLKIDAHDSTIKISIKDYFIHHYDLKLVNSMIRIETTEAESFALQLDQSEGVLLLGDIQNEINISAINDSTLYLYQTVGQTLNLNSSRSVVDIREVYVQSLSVITIYDEFSFINSNTNNQPSPSYITTYESNTIIKGVTYDIGVLPI